MFAEEDPYGNKDRSAKVKTLELLKTFKDKEFYSMEEFFDFINVLEDEGEHQLVLLDITGNTNRTNRYRIVCPYPACSFSLTWSLALDFKNDMKCHARLIPANAFRQYHEHNS